MFSSMPTSFSLLKTATNPNFKNQPTYAVVSALWKPQHMLVFLTLEKTFASAGYEKTPVFEPGRKSLSVVLV